MSPTSVRQIMLKGRFITEVQAFTVTATIGSSFTSYTLALDNDVDRQLLSYWSWVYSLSQTNFPRQRDPKRLVTRDPTAQWTLETNTIDFPARQASAFVR